MVEEANGFSSYDDFVCINDTAISHCGDICPRHHKTPKLSPEQRLFCIATSQMIIAREPTAGSAVGAAT